MKKLNKEETLDYIEEAVKEFFNEKNSTTVRECEYFSSKLKEWAKKDGYVLDDSALYTCLSLLIP